MNPYTYQKAATLADAVAARSTPGGYVLAGGTDLIAQMKAGQRQVSNIIDVKKIPELANITEAAAGGLEIGAAVSATSLAHHAAIQRDHAGLHDGVQLIGSLQIQNRATLGGNICNAAPSADAVPGLIVDGAMARIAGPQGERVILLEDLFAGPGRTTLGQGELLVSIILPAQPPSSASAYLRFTPRREMDIAIAGVGARITCIEGVITEARIALASVAPTPLRAASAERALIGKPVTSATFAAAATAAQGDAQPISDTRASADYRRELVGVLTRRALATCAKRLGLEVLE